MRYLVLFIAISVAGSLLCGCESTGKPTAATTAAVEEAAKTSQCTACKDSFVWKYNSKGLPTTRIVQHTCPMCKKGWAASLSEKNTCGECAKAEQMCPMCRKAGG